MIYIFLQHDKAVLTKKSFLVLKMSMEQFLVGFGASGVGFGAVDVGVRRSVLQIMGFGGQKCGDRPPSLSV